MGRRATPDTRDTLLRPIPPSPSPSPSPVRSSAIDGEARGGPDCAVVPYLAQQRVYHNTEVRYDPHPSPLTPHPPPATRRPSRSTGLGVLSGCRSRERPVATRRGTGAHRGKEQETRNAEKPETAEKTGEGPRGSNLLQPPVSSGSSGSSGSFALQSFLVIFGPASSSFACKRFFFGRDALARFRCRSPGCNAKEAKQDRRSRGEGADCGGSGNARLSAQAYRKHHHPYRPKGAGDRRLASCGEHDGTGGRTVPNGRTHTRRAGTLRPSVFGRSRALIVGGRVVSGSLRKRTESITILIGRRGLATGVSPHAGSTTAQAVVPYQTEEHIHGGQVRSGRRCLRERRGDVPMSGAATVPCSRYRV